MKDTLYPCFFCPTVGPLLCVADRDIPHLEELSLLDYMLLATNCQSFPSISTWLLHTPLEYIQADVWHFGSGLQCNYNLHPVDSMVSSRLQVLIKKRQLSGAINQNLYTKNLPRHQWQVVQIFKEIVVMAFEPAKPNFHLCSQITNFPCPIAMVPKAWSTSSKILVPIVSSLMNLISLKSKRHAMVLPLHLQVLQWVVCSMDLHQIDFIRMLPTSATALFCIRLYQVKDSLHFKMHSRTLS